MLKETTYGPRQLIKNVRYPLFQLAARAANAKTPPEDALKIAALTVAHWLRERFREFDLPQALRLPEPAEYRTIDAAALPSFHISMGYTVEVVSLPEEGAWTMRLIEPDLGSDPTSPHQARAAVPGRILETNAAFRIVGETLECGFQTLAAEPEGTAASCEVLRPVFVKELARNPLVGLVQGYPIEDKLWRLSSAEKLKQLRDYLKIGALPAVVIAERQAAAAAPASAPVAVSAAAQLACNLPPADRLARLLQATERLPAGSLCPVPPAPHLPYDTAPLTRYKMAYAQFFCLPSAQRGEFAKILKREIDEGETLLLEPAAFGGGCVRYPYCGEAGAAAVHCAVQEYPKGKPVRFERVWFLADAQLRRQAGIDNAKELAAGAKEQQTAAAAQQKAKFDAALQRKDEDLAQLRAKLTQAQGQIAQAGERARAVQAAADEKVARIEAQLRGQEDTLRYFRSLPQRPSATAEIPAWARKNLSEHLLFHPKAADLISKTPTSEVDVKVLCDALEYLATEYWACNEGQMTAELAKQRCAEKYDRPFEVRPTGRQTVRCTPAEYTIKYRIGAAGKPIETPLNLHLKVGNAPENLLRIYFLYDTEKRLVVVGSLPKHLTAVQMR